MKRNRMSLFVLGMLALVVALSFGLLAGCKSTAGEESEGGQGGITSQPAVCGRSAFLHESNILFFGYGPYLCTAAVNDAGVVSEFTVEAGLSSDILSLAVDDGSLFVADRDGLYAFALDDMTSGNTASSIQLFDEQISKGFEIWDGYVYFLYGGTLYRVPIAGGEANALYRGIADFDIFGGTIYFTTTDKGLYQMPIEGEGVCLATLDDTDCYIAVSDDCIYTKSEIGSTIACYSFDSKEYSQVGVEPAAGEYSVMFACQNTLLYSTSSGQVCVADFESGEIRSPEGQQAFLVDKASSFLAGRVLYTLNTYSHELTVYDFTSNKAVVYDTAEEMADMLAQVQGGASGKTASKTASKASSDTASYGVSDDWSTASGSGWTAQLPEDWRGFVGAEVSDGGKSVRFYLAEQEAKGYGGTLVTIIRSTDANPPYPHFDLIHSFSDGSYLYADYPTDVQYDPSNPGQYPACDRAVSGFLKMMEF